MVFISLIIPFNKGKRYLKDCLESISNQNLKNEEVILILNGCDENLTYLLKEYESKLNLIIKNFSEQINVSKARNEGLKIATGKYIYFIDSDDYIYSNGLNKLVNVAKNTDADFINGERISTLFILDRFNEELEKESREILKKNKLSDNEFSIKLLVSPKTNSQEVLSILHALIKRKIFEGFSFDESKRYFSDYDFFNRCLSNIKTFVGVEDALYAKRARDDQINLKSLNQEPKKDQFLLYINEYNNVISTIKSLNNDNYNLLKDEMAASYLKYYIRNFAKNYKYGSDKWRDEYFNAMVEVSKDFNLDGLDFFKKQEVKSLQTKNIKKLKILINCRLGVGKLKNLYSFRNFKIFLYSKYYNKKEIKTNKILFSSFIGRFYTDSPKYLYEYLYKNYGDKYEFVWVVNDKNMSIPGNAKKVKRFSIDYYREVATSKYWVINGRQPARLKKHENQVIISTWHGTPLKKLGLDMGNVYTENPNIKNSYIKVARDWDYLLSPNEYTTKILRSAFNYDGEILQLGYPRNDILYNASNEDLIRIKNNLNLHSNKKIILYAPTWRDDEFYDYGKVNFNLKLDLDKLKQELSDDYILLIRTHYFIADNLDLSDYNGFAYDVSKYSDIAELYLISDILITDYSSVFFDFANLKRPILFYTYDLDKYENLLRGFYIDIRNDVPGPLLFTTEEVIDAIVNIDGINEEYCDKYNKFYNKYCDIDDGNASKKIIDKLGLN